MTSASMYTSEMRHSNGCPSYLHHQYGMGACPAATPQSAVRWLAWTDEYGARYTSQGVERRHLRLNLGVEEVTGIRMDDWHLTIGLGVLLRDTLASSPEAKDRSRISRGSVKMRAYARRLRSGPVPYVAGRPCKQRESTRNRYGVTPASAFARHSEVQAVLAFSTYKWRHWHGVPRSCRSCWGQGLVAGQPGEAGPV